MTPENSLVVTWQEILDTLTSKVISEGTFVNLNEHATEDKFIACLLENDYKDELLQWITAVISSTPWEKSVTEAKSQKELGNKHFYDRKYGDSLAAYTKCIQYAPISSEELPLAFANRSASFFHLKMFEDSLKDVSMAFETKYPAHLQHKLYQRQGECFLNLQQNSDALLSFKLAKQLLETTDLPQPKKSALSKNIKETIQKVELLVKKNEKSGSEHTAETFCLPIPLGGKNEVMVGAAKALELRLHEEKGRYVVTNRDIDVGDILFVEKPFAFVLLPGFYSQRCHHCCKELKSSVPCWNCIGPLYCDEVCQKYSWDQYHKWECHGGLNVAHSLGIAHLGLRIVLKAGTLEQHKLFNEALQSSQTVPSNMSNYASVYHLMTHLHDLTLEDRIAYALTALCLVLYLRYYTDYLTSPMSMGVRKTTDTKDDEILIGGVLLHHITQLVCNGHAITDLEHTSPAASDNILEERLVRIATAIYPSASMMNHSCNSNIINSFHGQYLIVKASRSIPCEGEVFNCYGPCFRTMSRELRKEILKLQYCFDCACEECLKTDQIDFKLRFTALLCSLCKGPLINKSECGSNTVGHEVENSVQELVCYNCGSRQKCDQLFTNVLKANDLYKKGCVLMETGDVKEALRLFLQCSCVQHECLHEYHEDCRACLNNIARCYALLGKYYQSVYFILKTLPAVEQQFGTMSLEMANEIQKLTDVMLSDLKENNYKNEIFLSRYEETMKYIQKAKTIMKLYYGEWNSSFQEIIWKENMLKSMLRSVISGNI